MYISKSLVRNDRLNMTTYFTLLATILLYEYMKQFDQCSIDQDIMITAEILIENLPLTLCLIIICCCL